MTPTSAIEQFRSAIRSAGLDPPEVIEADGGLHRFPTNGKPADDAGWYALHLDGIPAGAYGDWRTGSAETWRADIGRNLSKAEEAEHRARLDAIRRQREADAVRRATDAAAEAVRIWREAAPAEAHPYLVRKGIAGHGVRQFAGRLVIPMRTERKLCGLQFIANDGEKRFLLGTRTAGAYFSIGKPDDGTLLVAEGFATGASLHEATGYAVAVAFSAGNLERVARAVRAKFPRAKILIAGDNDRSGIGRTRAHEAAQAIGGLVALPARSGKDWNDVHLEEGVDAVSHGIEAVRAPDAQSEGDGVRLIRASDLKPEPIRWLWDGWLARGKLHIIAGAQGTGKTTLCLALAATITTGGQWPDESRCTEPGNVLIWSGEDDPEDTLYPRLLAMGADPQRIYFIDDVLSAGQRRAFDPAIDLNRLAEKAAMIGRVRLMIVDPVVNAVRGDSHKNTEVRRALQPLVTLATELDAVVVGVSHFSKGSAGRDPVERVTGSLAFGALPRVVLAAAKVTNDDGQPGRILARAKSNIGPDDGGYGYSLEQVAVPGYSGLFASAVLWCAPISGSARDLLAQGDADDDARSSLSEAKRFLQKLLSDGPVSSKQVRRDADGVGLTLATVRRAQKALGVEARKLGMQGGWVWSLPRRCSENAEDAHAQMVSTFEKFEHLREPDTDVEDF